MTKKQLVVSKERNRFKLRGKHSCLRSINRGLEYPFSHREYSFIPEKKDWETIKKLIPTIHLSITNRCNSFCKICITNSRVFDFSKDISKLELIYLLKKIGRGKRVVLIGGEPTVRNDLFEIIRLIKKSGNQPEIFTNGLKLSNSSYVRKLKECGIKRVYLSFDSFRKEYYEKMTGNSDELLLKLVAIKNLDTFGIETILCVRVVRNLNEQEIGDIINFVVKNIKKRGHIRGILFYGATPGGRFLIKNGAFSWKELLHLVERHTKGVASWRYFLECKKLCINSFVIGRKLKLLLNFGLAGWFAPFIAGSIKKLFKIGDLRELNNALEKGKIFSALKRILRNRIYRRLLAGFILKRNVIEAISFIPRAFFIGIGNINTEKVCSFSMRDNVWIEKGIEDGVIIKTTGFFATYQR